MTEIDKKCPFCYEGEIEKNYKCNICETSIIEFNIIRRSSFLDYFGSGMSTHAGLMAGLSFALLSTLQFLLDDKIMGNTFRLIWFISFGFQAAIGYVIHRFLQYRNGGKAIEKYFNSPEILQLLPPNGIPGDEGVHAKNNIGLYVRKYITGNYKWVYIIFFFLYNGIIVMERLIIWK